jgi:DNA-binding NarL/FixJ family response regulator
MAPGTAVGSAPADPVNDPFLARARGRTPYGPRAETRAHPYGLTRRERVVLELLAAGNRDADIAAALGIRPKTASNHVGAILAKLGVHNRTQAAAYAHIRQSNP